MFGEPHGPAFLEGSEIGLDGLERRAGLFMPVDERDLDGGAIPVDHQIARVEMLDLVALQDQVPALECHLFPVARPFQGMDRGRNVGHMAEIVGQIACQPLKVLRPPGIIDVAGGTAAGAALKDLSLGKPGDAISGAIGGGVVGQILAAVMGGAAAGGGDVGAWRWRASSRTSSAAVSPARWSWPSSASSATP
jgi:hypothetical protein